MVKEKIERSHRFEGDELVLIRKQIGENGSGKKVVVTSEEFSVTEDEVKEVLEKHVPERLADTLKKIEDMETDLKKLKEQAKEFENTREFIEFKKFLEENKHRFDQVKIMSDIGRMEKQIEYLKDQSIDIEDWRKQMSDIKF